MKDRKTTDFVNYATILNSAPKEYFDMLFRVNPGQNEDVTKSSLVWSAKKSREDFDFEQIPSDASERISLSKKWMTTAKKLAELRGLSGYVAFYIIADKKDRDTFEDYIQNVEFEQDVAKALFTDAVEFMTDYDYIPVICTEHKMQMDNEGNPNYTHYHFLFVSKYQVGTKKHTEILEELQNDLVARGSKILDGKVLN